VTRTSAPDAARVLVLSKSAVALADETLASIKVTPVVAEKEAVGELRDVHAAGYPNFLGIAGRHRFFHTPGDDVSSTGPDILEPVARAFTEAVRKIAERGQGAFR
jgi:hypothetical protein